MLAKVRKLLAKAEDPACPPAEAEALTAKATQLIAKYGIDQALLAAERPGADRIGDRRLEFGAPYALDRAVLLDTVARRLRCRAVQTVTTRSGRRYVVMHLFGFGTDLERVEILFTSLLVQAAHALVAEPVPRGANKAAWRRSWYAGFTATVGHRLTETEREARRHAERTEATGKQLDLVLADRSALVDRAVSTEYPHLVSRRRVLSGRGYDAGREAGDRADLGGPRMDAGRSDRAIGA